ncbi:glutamate--tRNA ligase [Alicyclobacillus mengziensis]|uniref:Glutamate--tRNA ligase n=1 Tax=Alicyclobacillus mengziensis TaxID=2931921 RepID=A0A9X7VVN3_9BACL|nr:glutamate--tRNA ligase [Alicyclobacillus mengziensis]QSO45954.1 glutamate--tRNA ligase [Alicyclobacillus mengziensis]
MTDTTAENTVRVRFAPSPTGSLHIGGARTAYFNWLFARQHQGVFVLRIDDTDQKRSTEASYQQILESFRWLEIDWDEGPDVGGEYGPYRQSLRHHIYNEQLNRLFDEGKVYPCFCTPEQLAEDRENAQKRGETPRYSGRCRHLSKAQQARRLENGEPAAYRLRCPDTGTTIVHDIIRGDVEFQNTELDDFIVWKTDNTPTYHFASCVDDALMHITHVIRAEEHLSNTPRHVVLFEALGFTVPKFAHVPMILAPDRSKLSKRHGATSVEEYREQGILPEALVNYLLLLGFSPGEDREVLSQDEAVSVFNLERVAKHAAVYDVKKLEWLNAHYLRKRPLDTVLQAVWSDLEQRGWVESGMSREQLAWVRTLVSAMQERARTLPELVESLRCYFEDVTDFDAKGIRKYFEKPEAAARLRLAADALETVLPFTVVNVEQRYRELIAQLGVKAGELIHPTRLALTGVTGGPSLFEVMAMLGREVCQARLRAAADKIENGVLSKGEARS